MEQEDIRPQPQQKVQIQVLVSSPQREVEKVIIQRPMVVQEDQVQVEDLKVQVALEVQEMIHQQAPLKEILGALEEHPLQVQEPVVVEEPVQ